MTALGFAVSLVIALPVLAATTMQGQGQGWGGSGGMHRGAGTGGVFGTVSAVSGTTLTVTSKMRPNATSTAATAYTVDASSAKVYEGGVTTTVPVSNIAVGDTVMVQGTVSGSNVVATMIRDGVSGMMGRSGTPEGKGFGVHSASSTPRVAPASAIQGNGEPVIGGAVTAIDGTMLTVTNASNVTYDVNAASSTVVKDGASTTITSVAVGDNLIVQGAVSGTSVTASSVIDQGSKGGNASSNGAQPSVSRGGGFGFGGIFSAIGGFFKHLFGF